MNPGTLQLLCIKTPSIQSNDADFYLGLQQATRQQRELPLGSRLIECWNDVCDSDRRLSSNAVSFARIRKPEDSLPHSKKRGDSEARSRLRRFVRASVRNRKASLAPIQSQRLPVTKSKNAGVFSFSTTPRDCALFAGGVFAADRKTTKSGLKQFDVISRTYQCLPPNRERSAVRATRRPAREASFKVCHL